MRISDWSSDVCSSDLGSLNVTAVGDALRDALAKPVGKRPYRIFVDGQKKGVEDILAIKNARQAALLEGRSEEHTSELQSLMRISYAVFCLKKKKTNHYTPHQPYEYVIKKQRVE